MPVVKSRRLGRSPAAIDQFQKTFLEMNDVASLAPFGGTEPHAMRGCSSLDQEPHGVMSSPERVSVDDEPSRALRCALADGGLRWQS